MSLRRRSLNVALVLLVLWAGLALAREVRHLQWRQAGDRWFDDEPCLWRYGTPPTDRLERFLDAARPVVEPSGDGIVYFGSRFERNPAGAAPSPRFSPRDQSALCAYLWAVYLSPEVTLRRVPPDGPPPAGSSWLVFGGPADDRAASPTAGLPTGFEPILATGGGVIGRSAQ